MNQPFVTCHFSGQLGNQLFIIAATLSHAWDHRAIPLFPGLFTEKNRTNCNRVSLFGRLDASALPRPILHKFEHSHWCNFEKILFQPDQILIGYFQSWKFFHHHKDEILELLAPSEFTVSYLDKKYASLIQLPNTVGVHVRTAGKVRHSKGFHPFLGIDYYKKAFEMFPKDFIFVVCSDRIDWCEVNFKKFMPERKFVFVKGNYGIEDLFLLSKMKHVVMANSTFSWWASYFNSNQNAKIVAPDLWGGNPDSPMSPQEDLFLPEWRVLPVPPLAPYPEDMYEYETNDCDGNRDNV